MTPNRGAFTKDELKQKRVGVLLGGMSAERDVSLRTGEAVSGALRGLGYDVVEIDVGRDLPARLAAEKVDVAWLAVHGRYGEDGCLQGLLESLFIPYTGSGVLASALGMDKVYAKQVYVAHGIPTPAYRSFKDAASALAAADSLPFPFPVVVKPSREGSSVGVHICKTRDAYEAAVTDAAKYAGTLLVEQFVKGREVQGGVLDDEALGVIEVRAAREFYDYDAKYKAGTGTQYLFPAPLPPDQYARVNEVCLAAHQALGCSGGSRSDVIVTDGGDVFLLETNTLPGMTASSLLPKIAAGRGIDFPALCERLLLGACLKA
ncbi:D-alanine--D-alanine ligase [Myxococcus xanthus DK 1622]|uniref:D-alanine--D-alanine ligase n=1 Tax=Myxococcus xanthus (strain DK1622) TaxID=246197 RepID=Q1D0T3_MYXXD|nr:MULTISPECIES: D-alanine--D-alanine ligase [Myxococcus]ABF90004.1 D-alanine--D-alanine ligase [Myxococcus xanthus DK 1622]NOJ54041.1 D-alanine--D-alanine ligase [Myxococcus xanthus]QPM78028.1 D-alanine--D-alanine ligase [Myxococcus xanthus]QVW67096.1 D-alanine--D-alanine ligase [Myxococcus xanthus DZ2]QZZ53241.1 D-alanine--D-alanine ligase [Myxococcus xanthus]